MAGQQPANMWKVGTSEKSFAEWAAKVLALGYNVGRWVLCWAFRGCGHAPSGLFRLSARGYMVFDCWTVIRFQAVSLYGIFVLVVLTYLTH